MSKVFLSVLFTCLFAISNAQTWSPVGSGTTFGQVESMCVYNGELYVGGYFNTMGGIPVNSLAKWNGTSWDSVPGISAFPGIQVADMVVWQNQLVVVGNQIHTWNGTTWGSLGGWVNGGQSGVEVFNTELYITGNFSNAGGTPTRGIAKWNGTQWDSLGGPGLNTSPGYSGNDLMSFNGDLILTGGFTSVNGVDMSGIAAWDGILFDSVGSPTALQSGLRLVSYNNNLYVSGTVLLDSVGHFIGRWNGLDWDSVGLGLNRSPRSMSVYNNELYVMGEFDSAGQQPILGIARWNDTTWNSVGSGLDLMNTHFDTIIIGIDTFLYPQEFIVSSCVYNNELYVGGFFSMIGGVAANSIAKWHDVGAAVNESPSVNTVTVFPNPSSTTTTFQFSGIPVFREIIVTDQLGREIWRRKTSELLVEFPAFYFSSGLYFYSIIENDSRLTTGKLLIEH